MNALATVGTRLALFMEAVGLSQSEFANTVGVAQGFVSDVIRNAKKPGAEFLFALRSYHRVSIDWLLTGEGTMFGGVPINLEAFKLITSQMALAKAAVGGSTQANTLVRQIMSASSEADFESDKLFKTMFAGLTKADEEMLFSAVLYNASLWTAKPFERMRSALGGAMSYMQSKRPFDVLEALRRPPSGHAPYDNPRADFQQFNTGNDLRIAGRDYVHGDKPRKKK